MSILSEIGQTSRCYAIFRAKRLEEKGIFGTQYLYLINIHNDPGISQDQLAERLIFNKSSVARQLSTLEANGLVCRERSKEDKRILLCTLTEKAEALIEDIHQTSRDFLSQITSDLTPEELEKLTLLMRSIKEKAKEAIRQP